MNILFLNIAAGLGGAERNLLTEVAVLRRKGVGCIAGLLNDGPLVPAMEAVGVPCHIFPVSRFFRSLTKERSGVRLLLTAPFFLVEAIWLGIRISHFARENKIDLILSNSFKTHFVTTVVAALGWRAIVWRYNDRLPDSPCLRSLSIFLAKRVPRVITATSEYIYREFAQYAVSGDKVTVAYPAFCSEDFVCSPQERETFRQEYGLAANDFVIGVLGMLVYWKGQANVIRAVKLLAGRIAHLKVLIVGSHIYDTDSKDTHDELVALVHELGLDHVVQFIPFVAENRTILNALDMLVHTPTRPEPFGRVAVEGLLCQKPVIVAAQGGLTEIVQDGKTGVFVPPEDPGALAEAIDDLYRDPQRAKALARAGYEDVKARFDQEKIVEDVLLVYRTAAGQL